MYHIQFFIPLCFDSHFRILWPSLTREWTDRYLLFTLHQLSLSNRRVLPHHALKSIIDRIRFVAKNTSSMHDIPTIYISMEIKSRTVIHQLFAHVPSSAIHRVHRKISPGQRYTPRTKSFLLFRSIVI